MRSNPNEILPQHTAEYVQPGSQVTVSLRRGRGDLRMPDHIWNDLIGTVWDALADCFYGGYSRQVVESSVNSELVAVLTTVSEYPAGVTHFHNALRLVAKAYNVEIVWSFGLSRTVTA